MKNIDHLSLECFIKHWDTPGRAHSLAREKYNVSQSAQLQWSKLSSAGDARLTGQRSPFFLEENQRGRKRNGGWGLADATVDTRCVTDSGSRAYGECEESLVCEWGMLCQWILLREGLCVVPLSRGNTAYGVVWTEERVWLVLLLVLEMEYNVGRASRDRGRHICIRILTNVVEWDAGCGDLET